MNDNLVFTRRFTLLILTVFIIGRLLIMYLLPLVEPSEARYAVMARNMAETNEYLAPMFVFNGTYQCFEGKPALTFQMAAAACEIFGLNAFATRVPAFLAGLSILACVYFSVRKLRNESVANAATLLCLCSYLFYIFSGVMMTDMVLAAAVVGAIFCYILFESDNSIRDKKWWSIGFFACLSAGMIIKGPVAIVMAGLPVFFYTLINNKWAELRYHSWVFGSIVFLLISVPWYYMMTLKNPDFLYYFFVNENFNRFLYHDYGDKFGTGKESFRGMAVIWLFLSNLPLIFAIPFFSSRRRKAFFQRGIFSDPLTGMSILTVLTITGFWCLTNKSLIPYFLPTIPFVAVFFAVRSFDLGELAIPRYFYAAKRFILACVILFTIGTLSAVYIAPQIQPNVNTAIYLRLQQLTGQPDWEKTPLYFINYTPYSAEFYLKGKVCNHQGEGGEASLENSRNYILVASDRELGQLPHPINRKLLFKCQTWNVFAPEQLQGGESGKP